MRSTTRARRAALPAVLSLALFLSACGGSGHADLAAAPAPAPSVTPAATAGAAAVTTSTAGGPVAADAAATATPGAPKVTPTPGATKAPAPGPVPLVLDPKSIYDNWALAAATAHSVVLLISADSCHGGPQITVNETATSVTILITEQLFGPPDCHGGLKIVREVASIAAPLGKRYLEGCQPMKEKAGTKVNCRTLKAG